MRINKSGVGSLSCTSEIFLVSMHLDCLAGVAPTGIEMEHVTGYKIQRQAILWLMRMLKRGEVSLEWMNGSFGFLCAVK